MKRSDLKLRYVAVGCGHCGTGYVARLLTSAGVPCGHEVVFSHATHKRATERLDEEVPLGPPPCGIPWDQIQAESSWPGLSHLSHPCVAGATIIHIVRNPLHVLRSWMYGGDPKKGLATYAEQYLVRNWRIEDDCMTHNGRYVRYQVESRLQLLDELGIERRSGVEDNPNYNSHIASAGMGDVDVGWDDVEKACRERPGIFDRLVEMSELYGYGGLA